MFKSLYFFAVFMSFFILTACNGNEQQSQISNPDLPELNSETSEIKEDETLAGNLVSNLATITSLSGRTLYVCSSGSACGAGWATGIDSSTQGKSKSKPFKSIDYAVNQVASAGDLVLVGSGIYKGVSKYSKYAVVFLKKGGASGKPIFIKSEIKGRAVIDAAGVHSGIWASCDASPSTASYIRIDGFEIRNPNHVGVTVKDGSGGAPYSTCTNIELTNLKVHHFGTTGFNVENIKSSMIANNLIYTTTKTLSTHNQYHGVYLSDLSTDVLVKNNVIYGIKDGWPIHIYDQHGKGPAKNHKIINNTLINDNPYRGGGIVMFGSGHVIRNNLIYNRATISSSYPSAISERKSIGFSGTIIQNNITNMKVLCSGGCRGASISSNILGSNLATGFVSSSAQNFQLRSTSPAVNKGTLTGFGTRSGAPTEDHTNKKRYLGKSVDIGAHESF